MITDLTNSDNAGTVVDRINAAITEQDKGVSTLDADPNAGTVIARVNAAIDAENNNELDAVESSDNAGDFIEKVNDLFDAIRNGSSEPDPIVSYNDYWKNKKYIAFGDSLTHTSWTVALDKRYCYLAAQELEMKTLNDQNQNVFLTNAGVSGSMMLDNGAYDYPIGKDRNNDGVFNPYDGDSGVETPQRSFSKELLNPDGITIVDINETNSNQVKDHRGPHGVDLSQYDLITLMFGSNDINRIYLYENYPANQPQFAKVGGWGDTALNSFYGAYTRALDYIQQQTDAVVVICVPPACTNVNFKINNIEGAIRDIASKKNLPVIDFYNNCTVELGTDGIHPTEAGQGVMAEYFIRRLKEIAAELQR